MTTKPVAAASLEDEETLRGKCPLCQAPVRSRLVYVAGRGTYVLWRCDNSSPTLADDPTCDFMQVL
jgi:hypothetical protein